MQHQTVQSLVSVTLREVKGKEYRFCRNPSCPVVYFSVDGAQTFTTKQVRERVFQKEPQADDVLVCYCFRHSVGDLRGGSHTVRRDILADITAGIRADECACPLRNPQGSCCLGNVRTLLAQPARM